MIRRATDPDVVLVLALTALLLTFAAIAAVLGQPALSVIAATSGIALSKQVSRHLLTRARSLDTPVGDHPPEHPGATLPSPSAEDRQR